MTREEQRKLKEQKKQAKIAAKLDKKEETKLEKSWSKMVAMAKAKDAWIED